MNGHDQHNLWNWARRDVSVAKNEYYSPRGPELPSLYPHQAAYKPAAEAYLTSDFSRHLHLLAYAHTQTDTHTHNFKKIVRNFQRIRNTIFFSFNQRTPKLSPSGHLGICVGSEKTAEVTEVLLTDSMRCHSRNTVLAPHGVLQIPGT